MDYDGAAASGSNKSPTSIDVATRGQEIVDRYGATPDNPLPADLAAASGAGLDPHISEAGALFQAARVAEARGMEPAQVETLIERLRQAGLPTEAVWYFQDPVALPEMAGCMAEVARVLEPARFTHAAMLV